MHGTRHAGGGAVYERTLGKNPKRSIQRRQCIPQDLIFGVGGTGRGSDWIGQDGMTARQVLPPPLHGCQFNTGVMDGCITWLHMLGLKKSP